MRRLYDWLITFNPVTRSLWLAVCYFFLTLDSVLNVWVMSAQLVILINLVRDYYRVNTDKDKC